MRKKPPPARAAISASDEEVAVERTMATSAAIGRRAR